jgi:tetratricopeptide (TPR) repeat protein
MAVAVALIGAGAALFLPNAAAQPVQAIPVQADERLFPEDRPEEKGWKGLAKLLEALEPDVDTSIPLTPSQITDRISSMLDQGRPQEALDIIEKRKAQYAAHPDPLGNDVQLMFLHARALAALDRNEEAIDVYRDMTARYPELPEPWNNLAAEYVKTGRLSMANQALQMALQADPDYRDARVNLGRVQMLMAQESFQAAEQLPR